MKENPYKRLPPIERKQDGSLYRMTPTSECINTCILYVFITILEIVLKSREKISDEFSHYLRYSCLNIWYFIFRTNIRTYRIKFCTCSACKNTFAPERKMDFTRHLRIEKNKFHSFWTAEEKSGWDKQYNAFWHIKAFYYEMANWGCTYLLYTNPNECMVRKLIRQITIYQDRVAIEFKSGLQITINE